MSIEVTLKLKNGISSSCEGCVFSENKLYDACDDIQNILDIHCGNETIIVKEEV